MGAWESDPESQGFERDEGLRNDGRRRRKGDDVSNRTRGGSTPEGTILEMGVRSWVVVPMMRRHLHLVYGRTQFQQKRGTARRHEADRHVGTKQENYQQQAGH
jgi:hypothetical protein